MNSKYRIVRSFEPSQVEQQVNELINAGWVLRGDLLAIQTSAGVYYLQALVHL